MGLMDIMSLMGNSSDGQPGMMDQIRQAGESFHQISTDISLIIEQNTEILARLRALENQDGRNPGSKS